MAESIYNRFRSAGQEASAEKREGTSGQSPEENINASYNRVRQMGQETLRAQEAERQRQESPAEKRNKWTGKEIAKTGLGAVGGGAALGFLSVNYATKFLLRKVKGTNDFVNSWEWMEQTILGTRQRS